MCIIVCSSVSVSMRVCSSVYLREHDQSDQEGDGGHGQQEELSPVLPPEHAGVHVHDGRHQALHAHELVQNGN